MDQLAGRGQRLIPCYLTAFNSLTPLRRMVEDCRRLGLAPVLIDNDSTYPPLVEWLASNPCEVIRLGANFGPYAAWNAGVVRGMVDGGWYVVSDSDLDLQSVPDDAIAKMQAAFAAHPWATKVGLSLEIDDIPDHFPFKNDVMIWERRYWSDQLPDGNFRAPTDSTFALYHTDRPVEAPGYGSFFTAVRMDRPYTARHLPWYLDPEKATEEERFCFSKTCDGLSYWSTKIKRRLSGVSDEAPPA